ncbi:hypothetical protein [Emticicia sp. W12TSBA100-4]|uniref:hypothetical protein n=1 Tax=Emticicia sp. W12TSBA100-4 TaxID=3160965 RepID=UPI003305D72C
MIVCMIIALSFVAKAQTSCDYNSSDITFNIGTPGILPSNSLTTYLLVDHATGIITKISSTQSFTGISQSKQYDIYAYSYVNDNTVTGLTVGGTLTNVSAACGDFSKPLLVNICVPPSNAGVCDYTTTSFTLKTVTSPPAGATTEYILTDLNGVILQKSVTPSFTGLTGTQSYNVYAVSYTGSISNLSIGSNYSTITGACYDLSNAFPVKVCVCQPTCLGVTLTKVK